MTISTTQYNRCQWIVSKEYDLFFFIGSSALTFIFFGLYQLLKMNDVLLHGESILLTYFIFTVLLDHPHIFQTFSRTHYDGQEYKKRRLLYTWGLGLLILDGFILTLAGYEHELIIFAAVFGSWHIIRQHWGFIRAYKLRNHDYHQWDNRLDFSTFFVGMFACFFHDYSGVSEAELIYEPLWVVFPGVPEWFSQLLWNIFLILLVIFILRQIYRYYVDKQINIPKLLLMSVAFMTHYFIFFVAAVPFLIAEVLETAFHNVQYQGWIMHYQKSHYPDKKNIVIKWLLASLLYGIIAGIIEIASLYYSGIMTLLFVPFSMFVLFHYYVDGVVWKFKHYPELKQEMFRQGN